MSDALELALRALRHRDRTAVQIEHYLDARGVGEHDRDTALATLRRTGLVDDRRYATSRASSLADRGAGDQLIRHDLEEAGVAADLVDEVLDQLPREDERAARVVARRGADAKTARYLVGKGFSEGVVRAVVAHSREEPLG